jgi:hypothetical protein
MTGCLRLSGRPESSTGLGVAAAQPPASADQLRRPLSGNVSHQQNATRELRPRHDQTVEAKTIKLVNKEQQRCRLKPPATL